MFMLSIINNHSLVNFIMQHAVLYFPSKEDYRGISLEKLIHPYTAHQLTARNYNDRLQIRLNQTGQLLDTNLILLCST